MTEQKTTFACKDCGQEFTILSDLRAHADAHPSSIAQNQTQGAFQPLPARGASSLKQWFPTALLGILFVLVVAQTIEVYRLRAMVTSEGPTTLNNGQQNSNLPPGLQNLPNMVGGC